MTLIISYIVIRGYIIPFYKSKAILDIKSGKFFGMLPVTALLFDIARINGYAEGLFKKNKRVCLTGSLMSKLIFEDIGYFIENCRAGYDVDFINKVKQNSLTRSINKDVCLRYFGINFAANISDGYNKIKLYSKSGWSAYGDRKPYLYFLMLIISLLVISFSQLIYIMTLIISYIVIRGYIIPFYKSKAILEIKSGKFFAMLAVTALLFDVARINGYADGLFKKNKNV
jgi:hypothetical protein